MFPKKIYYQGIAMEIFVNTQSVLKIKEEE